jgi:hypothetical protein
MDTFSPSSSQTLYISSANWNGATVSVTVKLLRAIP